MNIKPLPPLEYLNEHLNYNTETGVLTYKTGRRAGKQVSNTDAHGYKIVVFGKERYKGHRIAYYLGTGVEPEYIDHINGVRDDNRLVNIRSVSKGENQKNNKIRKDNLSGTVGVQLIEKSGKWRAVLNTKHIGMYDSKMDAQEARALAQLDAGYHDNHGRVG